MEETTGVNTGENTTSSTAETSPVTENSDNTDTQATAAVTAGQVEPQVKAKTFTQDQLSKAVQKRVNELNAKHEEEFSVARQFIQQYYDKYGDITKPQEPTPPAYSQEQLETIRKAKEAMGAVDKKDLEQITSQYDQRIGFLQKHQEAMQSAYIGKGNSELASWAKEKGITDEAAINAIGSAVATVVKGNPELLGKFQSGLFSMDTSYLRDALEIIEKSLFAKNEIKKQTQTASELDKRNKSLPKGLPTGGADFPAKAQKKLTAEERVEAAFRAFQKDGLPSIGE